MLVHLTGRRTGRSYRQPLSYVRDGDTLLTPGGGKWRLNLVEGEPVRMRLRGRDLLARPEIIDDVDEIERLLAVMIEANPAVGRFVRVGTQPDGRPDRERIAAAVRHGFRIVRWHLEQPA
jgi:hypothetical protein